MKNFLLCITLFYNTINYCMITRTFKKDFPHTKISFYPKNILSIKKYKKYKSLKSEDANLVKSIPKNFVQFLQQNLEQNKRIHALYTDTYSDIKMNSKKDLPLLLQDNIPYPTEETIALAAVYKNMSHESLYDGIDGLKGPFQLIYDQCKEYAAFKSPLYSKGKSTILHRATRENCNTLVENICLVNPKVINQQNHLSQRAIDIINNDKQIAVFKTLAAHGAIQNNTLMHTLCDSTKSTIYIRKFICSTHPEQVNILDKNKNTPLHTIMRKGIKYKNEFIPEVTLFLKHGADINAQNKYGNTPLMRLIISETNCIEEGRKIWYLKDLVVITKLFIQDGLNLQVKNNRGETTEDLLDNLIIAYKKKTIIPGNCGVVITPQNGGIGIPVGQKSASINEDMVTKIYYFEKIMSVLLQRQASKYRNNTRH